MSVNKYSTTPAANTTVGDGSDTVSIAEGMLRGSVNNAMRAIASDVAKMHADMGDNLTAGTGSAYTLTLDSDYTAYDGMVASVRFHTACLADATLNVNGLGAITIRAPRGGALSNVLAGDLVEGQVVTLTYDGSNLIVTGAARPYISYDAVQDLLASDEVSRGTGAIWSAGVYRYEELAVASSTSVENAAGVALEPMPDKGFVSVQAFGAVGDADRTTGTGTDDTDAIRKAFATTYNIDLGAGIYRCTDAIWNTKENRIVKGAGRGFFWFRDSRPDNDPVSCLLFTGTGTQRVLTRRKYRASSADANDTPLSAAFENHGQGAIFRDFSIELFCDYTDATPTNYGADWDVGFFNGCRAHVSLHEIFVLGYFRKASYLWDGTRGRDIPELTAPDGTQIPVGTYTQSGADGCMMFRCGCVGGRVGMAVLGPNEAKSGADYYDEATDALYTDRRGGSGMSDFRDLASDIYSVQHHSGYRSEDPIGFGAELTWANMELEDDFAAAAVYIDMYVGTGSISKAYLEGNRYASMEKFRVRLGRCDDIVFGPKTHIEAGASELPGVFDTAGNAIEANEYTNNTYGHIASHPRTQRFEARRVTGGVDQKWVYDFDQAVLTDSEGKMRRKGRSFIDLDPDVAHNIVTNGQAGFMSVFVNPEGGTAGIARNAYFTFDVAASPGLSTIYLGVDFETAPVSTDLTPLNTTADAITVSAHTGFIQVLHRFSSNVRVAWAEAGS